MKEELTQYLNKRFDKVDGELTTIKGGLKKASEERRGMNDRLGNVEGKLVNVEDRLGNVEEGLVNVKDRLGNVEIKVVNLEVDMKEVKGNVRETKDTINKLFNRIDKFLEILERLDQEFTVMKEDIKRVKKVIKEKLGVDLF
jgi:chromosome segregation ATPase